MPPDWIRCPHNSRHLLPHSARHSPKWAELLFAACLPYSLLTTEAGAVLCVPPLPHTEPASCLANSPDSFQIGHKALCQPPLLCTLYSLVARSHRFPWLPSSSLCWGIPRFLLPVQTSPMLQTSPTDEWPLGHLHWAVPQASPVNNSKPQLTFLAHLLLSLLCSLPQLMAGAAMQSPRPETLGPPLSLPIH